VARATDSREGNQLLAALSPAERQRLQPQLEWVALPAGANLYSAGASLRHVYFPTTAVISLVSSMRDGATVEVGTVGSEGVAGVCAFMGSREALCSALSGLGFEVLPSAANFVFARHRQRDAAELAAALRQRGIIVRHFNLPRIDQHLRITIGTDAQGELLIEALREILA